MKFVRSLSRRNRLLFLIGLVAGGLAVAQAPPRDQNEEGMASRDARYVNAPILPEICSGDQSSVAAMKREAPFEVLIPDHELARDETVAEVRRCGQGTFMVRFQSGLRLSLQLKPFTNPAEKFRSMDEEYEDMTYAQVRGGPGLLTEPNAGSTAPADGAVSFVHRNAYVQILGNSTEPIERLTEVAESMRSE